METITRTPPSICNGPMVSFKKIKDKAPAVIGSRVAVILAWVERIRLIPSKYNPNGTIVPNTPINNIHPHATGE